MNKALYLDQQELEIESIDLGITRYFDTIGKRQSSFSTPEMSLLSDGIKTLGPAILKEQHAVLNGEVSKGVRRYGRPLLTVDADKLAAITLISIFNNAGHDCNPLTLSGKISAAVKDQKLLGDIKEKYKEKYKQLNKRIKTWDARAVKAARKTVGVTDDWSYSVKAHLGMKLLDLALRHTDFFELTSYHDANAKIIRRVMIKDEYRLYLETQHNNVSVMYPYYRPMIVPPKDWVSPTEGGYCIHTLEILKDTTNKANRDLISELGPMPKFYKALNGIQSTPYQINKDQYHVARRVWEMGGHIGNLPPSDPHPLPSRPSVADEEAFQEWKVEAAKIYGINARLIGKRRGVLTDLWMCDLYKDYDKIWYVWQGDWRGRAYPVGTFLHPQADEFSKSLLQFGGGKELGEHGLYHLTLHLGNCLGFDKENRHDRIRIVNDAREDLREWVRDPYTNQGWTRTDKPFMALAAARDWCHAISSANPEYYVSKIPTAIDGRCNGLQHFSAIGRDPIGGGATNLLPSDKPSDIYSDVARLVNASIANDDDPRAALWAGKVSRATVKRAVMTTPYGVTGAGIVAQFVDDGHCESVEGNDFKNAAYLRDKTIDAIGNTVVKAKQYMEWLQGVATLGVSMEQPICWTTAMGLNIKQEYLEYDMKYVETVLQKVSVRLPGKEPVLRRKKQTNSISPNYIHSVDADHMFATFLAMPEGTSFMPVHDSFSTHAADMDTLNRVVREEFVNLHKSNPIERFKEQVEKQLGVELPPLPERGNLDLDLVLESEGAFD